MARDIMRNSPTSALTPQRLFEPLNWLRGEFDRFFDDLSVRNLEPSLLQGRAHLPALEMQESDNHYRLCAELPGMTADDVEIDVAEGILTISGEKKEQREEHDKEKGFMFSERRYGRFQRSVQLPSSADPDSIEARFDNGVLTVTIGKSAKADKKRITINKGSGENQTSGPGSTGQTP